MPYFGKMSNLSLSDCFLTICPGLPLCLFWCHSIGDVQCQFEIFTDFKWSTRYNDTYVWRYHDRNRYFVCWPKKINLAICLTALLSTTEYFLVGEALEHCVLWNNGHSPTSVSRKAITESSFQSLSWKNNADVLGRLNIAGASPWCLVIRRMQLCWEPASTN